MSLYLSDNQIAERFGVGRVTIWRWVKEAGLPKPIRLSAGCTRWRLSDLERWEAGKIGQNGVANNESASL